MVRNPALTALLLATSTSALAQTAPTHGDVHRLHNDPKAYMASLDDPERDGWQKPHEVLTALDLKAGQQVADIGAGSGYFALRFAHHVGQAGKVYAVDISPDMLAEVKKRAAAGHLANVEPVLATLDDPGLPSASLDVIFICDTWHHIEARPAYLQKLKKALKPGGRLAIVDFHKDAPVGPPPDMKLTREEVRREAEGAGFVLKQDHAFLPHQYFLVFTAS